MRRKGKNSKIPYRAFQWIGGQLGELVLTQKPEEENWARTEVYGRFPALHFLQYFHYLPFWAKNQRKLWQKTHWKTVESIDSGNREKFSLWADLSKFLRLIISEPLKTHDFPANKTKTLQGKVSRTEQFSRRGNLDRRKMLPLLFGIFFQSSPNDFHSAGRREDGKQEHKDSFKFELKVAIVRSSGLFFWAAETLLRSQRENKIWCSKLSEISWKIQNAAKNYHISSEFQKKKTPWTLLTFVIKFHFFRL